MGHHPIANETTWIDPTPCLYYEVLSTPCRHHCLHDTEEPACRCLEHHP